MQTSENIQEIATALAKAQAEFKSVAKSGQNNQQGYRYPVLDDYMAVVKPSLAKHGLALTSSVEDISELETRETRSGSKQYGVRVRVVTRLLHASGQWIEVGAWGEGLDTGDKAVYKAVTGARKYGVASLLSLATSDDPERDETANGKGNGKPQADQGGDDRATENQIKTLTAYAKDPVLPPEKKQNIAAALERGLTEKAAGSLIGKVRKFLDGQKQDQKKVKHA